VAHILANGVRIDGCDARLWQDFPDHGGMALVSSAMANAAAAPRPDRSLPIAARQFFYQQTLKIG